MVTNHLLIGMILQVGPLGPSTITGTESVFGSDVQYFENDTEEALSRWEVLNGEKNGEKGGLEYRDYNYCKPVSNPCMDFTLVSAKGG